MRDIAEIKADIAYYEKRQRHAPKNQDFSHKINEYGRELLFAITNGIPLDQLETYCDAIRDGRCVVMPVKVGDVAYINTLNTTVKMSVWSVDVRPSGIWITDGDRYSGRFGKTVFLTRAEAEAALRKEQSDAK